MLKFTKLNYCHKMFFTYLYFNVLIGKVHFPSYIEKIKIRNN